MADSQTISSTGQRGETEPGLTPCLLKEKAVLSPVLTPSQPKSLAGLCSAGYLLMPCCFGHVIRESILPDMSDLPPAPHVELSTCIINVLRCFSKTPLGPSTPWDV